MGKRIDREDILAAVRKSAEYLARIGFLGGGDDWKENSGLEDVSRGLES